MSGEKKESNDGELSPTGIKAYNYIFPAEHFGSSAHYVGSAQKNHFLISMSWKKNI